MSKFFDVLGIVAVGLIGIALILKCSLLNEKAFAIYGVTLIIHALGDVVRRHGDE